MQFDTSTITRLCQFGRVLAALAIVMYLIDVLVPLFLEIEVSTTLPEGEAWVGTTSDIPQPQRWIVGLLIAVPQLLWTWGLWHLLRLFNGFLNGQVFSNETFRHLQWFGAMTVAMAISSPFFGIAAQLMLSNALFGEPVISVESSDILNTLDLLIAGTLVFALATTFKHAVTMSEEQALTI